MNKKSSQIYVIIIIIYVKKKLVELPEMYTQGTHFKTSLYNIL